MRVVDNVGFDVKKQDIPGGGSGQPLATPDWNQNDETAADYIKNRPFYTTDPVETELVNGTFAFALNSDFGIYVANDVALDLVEGGTYKVSIDGVEYETVCQVLNGFLYIGDPKLVFGGTTTYPFVCVPSQGIPFGTNIEGDSHEITIKATAASVVQIPDKYIPDIFREVVDAGYPTEWLANDCQKYYDLFLQNKILKVRTTIENRVAYVVSMFYARTAGLQMVVMDANSGLLFLERNDYTQKYYWSKFKDGRNLYIVNHEESAVSSGNIVYGYLSASDSNSLAYVSKDSGKTAITKAFMFNGDKELILASSTTDSTKKFKITVDDSGALAATEVTG